MHTPAPRSRIARARQSAHLLFVAFAVALPLCLVACAEAEDCDALSRPVFVTPALPEAVLGVAYDAVVEAEIKYEPDDDFYDYSFALDLALPPGLKLEHAGEERRAHLMGTPTQAGTFTVALTVYARVPDKWFLFIPGLCVEHAEERFQLVVKP